MCSLFSSRWFASWSYQAQATSWLWISAAIHIQHIRRFNVFFHFYAKSISIGIFQQTLCRCTLPTEYYSLPTKTTTKKKKKVNFHVISSIVLCLLKLKHGRSRRENVKDFNQMLSHVVDKNNTRTTRRPIKSLGTIVSSGRQIRTQMRTQMPTIKGDTKGDVPYFVYWGFHILDLFDVNYTLDMFSHQRRHNQFLISLLFTVTSKDGVTFPLHWDTEKLRNRSKRRTHPMEKKNEKLQSMIRVRTYTL